MFSITPPISRSTLCAISAARRATFCAAGCGVVTIRNFACGSSWASVIETSPVPGGRSTSRKSSSPHSTSSRNWVSALWSIGPRQTTAASSSTKKPIDMTFTPWASSGRILRSAETGGAGAEAEHARDRVAPDVGVEDADALAVGGERRGQVRGERRLADAALARADADDVGDLGQRALGQPARAAELLLQPGLLGVGEDVEADLDALHALERADRLLRRRSRSGCGSGSRAWSARR